MKTKIIFKNSKFSILKTLALIGMFFLISCGGGKMSDAERIENMAEVKSLVESRHFEIENQWANPLGGSQINLIGNINYIRFKGDSVEVYLPYFGVRHSGGGYGTEGGIKFEGPLENLIISENLSKKNISLEFQGKQGNESLDFNISLYSNGNSTTSVNSSQRSSISYRGTFRELKENNE